MVADAKVAGLHELPGCEELPCRRVAGGEGAKTLGELELVLEFLAEAGLDRSSGVITFGGGMVSDLGGMAAALFKRGVAVWHVPTTLLVNKITTLFKTEIHGKGRLRPVTDVTP